MNEYKGKTTKFDRVAMAFLYGFVTFTTLFFIWALLFSAFLGSNELTILSPLKVLIFGSCLMAFFGAIDQDKIVVKFIGFLWKWLGRFLKYF